MNAHILSVLAWVVFITCFGVWLIASFNVRQWRRLATWAQLFIAVGGLSFLAQISCALGAFNWLPSSFEWPAGRATGVLTTSAGGEHVVPLFSTGRIQVYGPDWNFLRGWHVDASGGTYKVFEADDRDLTVVTARGHRLFTYSLNGKLKATGTYDGPYSPRPGASGVAWVPTFWLLLPLSNPLVSFICLFIGFGLFWLSEALEKRRGS